MNANYSARQGDTGGIATVQLADTARQMTLGIEHVALSVRPKRVAVQAIGPRRQEWHSAESRTLCKFGNSRIFSIADETTARVGPGMRGASLQ